MLLEFGKLSELTGIEMDPNPAERIECLLEMFWLIRRAEASGNPQAHSHTYHLYRNIVMLQILPCHCETNK